MFRWFAAVDPDRAELLSQRMIEHLHGREDLSVPTENPMLLGARWGPSVPIMSKTRVL
jgi:hypothetical protein